MSKKFVRKIIGVKSIQNLRDYTNEIGDIVIKDGIHGYLRTEDEYKPITYPVIWDYGVDPEDKSRSDMHVNASGIHKLDTKKDTSNKYDLTDRNIKEQWQLKDDHVDISSSKQLSDYGIYKYDDVNNSALHEQLEPLAYRKEIDVATNPESNESVTIDTNYTHTIRTQNYNDAVDCSAGYDRRHTVKLDAGYLIEHTWGDKNGYWRDVSYANKGEMLDTVGPFGTSITLSQHSLDNCGVTINSNGNDDGITMGSRYYDRRNTGMIEFESNKKKLDFISWYDSNTSTYDFKIQGDDELLSKFVATIDNLLGFTSTINGLKQRISSLESRVTSLENR